MIYSRLYKITSVFKAYQLGELIPPHRWSRWMKLVIASLFWIRKRAKGKTPGERLRLALQDLGPIWVKFGQMLSTRHDFLPSAVAGELAQLQDRVDPFDGTVAIRLIEHALGHSIDSYFDDFELTPLASASIAQVHAARLKESQASVIIKVLRPAILDTIKADIAVMYCIADKLPKWFPDTRRLRTREVVRDYENTILNELDLLQEAENARRLRDNFIDSNLLYVPYVYRDLCRKTVLVEERVYGIPIARLEKLVQANVNLKVLAEKGVETFFIQVFRDNFFHADMHPGNIFVDISNPDDPRYIGIDCAIVGELTQSDQRYLAENFIAFFNRDYRKIAQLYIDSGWVSEDTTLTEFEVAMREVCEPIFAKPLGEISFAHVLFNLFHVARKFNMEVQPQLVLLEKTLFYIEGLGRQLYPQLDLWKTAKPFLEKWHADQMDIKAVLRRSLQSLPSWRELLPELPAKILAQERESRSLKTKMDHLKRQLRHQQQREKKQFYLMLGLIMIILGLLIRF